MLDAGWTTATGELLPPPLKDKTAAMTPMTTTIATAALISWWRGSDHQLVVPAVAPADAALPLGSVTGGLASVGAVSAGPGWVSSGSGPPLLDAAVGWVPDGTDVPQERQN